MNAVRFMWIMGVVSMLAASIPTARADDQFAPAGSTGSVTLSEVSYNSLVERLEALEASAGWDSDAADGWKPVDIISKPTLKVSGRVHFDYWPIPEESPLANFLETDDPAIAPQDFIGFRRLRFGVSGKVNETMEYKIEMEFAAPRDPTFKDAYLGWSELPVFRTVLLGNQKRPYGLDHLNSSRYNVFMERPFVVEAFNQDARRIGVCSYGVSKRERWNWRYGYFIMDDLSKLGGQYQDNYQSEIAGRLANTIWYDEASDGRGYAHWAVSGSAAFPGGGTAARFATRPEGRTSEKWYDTGSGAAPFFNNYALLGLEGVINVGPFSLVGEYMFSHVDRVGLDNVDFGGGYIYAAYWLTGEHTPWERESGTLGRTKPLENFFLVRDCDGGIAYGWGAWQVAARYSYGDFSDDDIFGGVGNSFTFGMNWWWNPNARVQFNYIHGNVAHRSRTANGFTFTDASGEYDIFGMRWMCDF